MNLIPTLSATTLLTLTALAIGQANTPAAVPGATAPANTKAATFQMAAPLRAYVKIDEPLKIRFLESRSGEGEKLAATFGLKAADVPGAFTSAAIGDVVDAQGKPLFDVFNFEDRVPLVAKPTKVEAAADGTVDVSVLYPDMKRSGTYVLTWRNSTPLVINSLYSPGRGARDIKRLQSELNTIPEEQRKEILDQFKPVVVHITPLEQGVIKTPQGEIKVTFFYDLAPHTVDNWTQLAKDGYYDDTTFHRIIKGFMIQGGDALGNTPRAGTGGPGYNVNAEFSDKAHDRGVLSMARSQDPNSAGAQFFIVHGKSPHLDGQYTAFAQVSSGIELVDKLAETPVTDRNGTVKGDRPKIESVKVLPATAETYGFKK